MNLPGGRGGALLPSVVAEFLTSTSLFRQVDRAVVDKVAPHLVITEHGPGSVIVRAGTPEGQIGLLFSGRASLRQINAATGTATVLEEVRQGDFFGEVAALLGTAQAYEVYAEDACVVFTLGKDVLGQLAGKIAPFAHALARRTAMRSVQAGVTALRSGGVSGAAIPVPPVAAAAPAADAAAADGVRFVRIATYDPGEKVISLVPAKAIAQYRLLPLELRGKTLTIGMVDPFNAAAVSELRRILAAVDLNIVAVNADEFNEAFLRLRIDPAVAGRAHAVMTTPEQMQFDSTVDEPVTKQVNVIGDEVVQLASRIIATAIDRQASDIHIEGESIGVKVRFRVQGSLQDWESFVAASFAKGLIARIKVLAGLDITERRLPQDGRIGLRVGKRDVDLRVSTLPTLRGEKVVMRLFEAGNMMRPLDAIFLEAKTLALVRAVLNKPYGALIVAGPTGSGKSSTLYSCLNERRKARPDTNIVTVEDPIECRLTTCTQVQVNHAVDLGFAKVLRAFLRQDPDVILVGEVRDSETAMLALEAAMTGHLLFTSLHANNAIAAIQRLENLGCSRTLISQSVSLILVQRLARKLCTRCVKTDVPPPIMMESLAARGLAGKAAPIAMPRAVGCGECNGSGYAGRVAVLEALELKDNTKNMLMAGMALGDIEKNAAESGALTPFRRYASLLMARNLISPSEALLVVA